LYGEKGDLRIYPRQSEYRIQAGQLYQQPPEYSQEQECDRDNSALEIDLTGQATAESLGKYFFSGIGGQADFMRGLSWRRREDHTRAAVYSRKRRDLKDRSVPSGRCRRNINER